MDQMRWAAEPIRLRPEAADHRPHILAETASHRFQDLRYGQQSGDIIPDTVRIHQPRKRHGAGSAQFGEDPLRLFHFFTDFPGSRDWPLISARKTVPEFLPSKPEHYTAFDYYRAST